MKIFTHGRPQQRVGTARFPSTISINLFLVLGIKFIAKKKFKVPKKTPVFIQHPRARCLRASPPHQRRRTPSEAGARHGYSRKGNKPIFGLLVRGNTKQSPSSRASGRLACSTGSQATLTRPPLVVTSPSIAPDPGFYGPSRPRKTSRSDLAAAKSPFFLAGSRREII